MQVPLHLIILGTGRYIIHLHHTHTHTHGGNPVGTPLGLEHTQESLQCALHIYGIHERPPSWHQRRSSLEAPRSHTHTHTHYSSIMGLCSMVGDPLKHLLFLSLSLSLHTCSYIYIYIMKWALAYTYGDTDVSTYT